MVLSIEKLLSLAAGFENLASSVDDESILLEPDAEGIITQSVITIWRRILYTYFKSYSKADTISNWLKQNIVFLKPCLTEDFRLLDDGQTKALFSFESHSDEGDVYTLIGPTPNFIDTFQNKQEIFWSSKKISFLKGLDDIPNLYLVSAMKIYSEQPDSLKKDTSLAQDDYLIKFLHKTFGINDIFRFKNFINENKSKLDKLRASFQYQPKYLGQGAGGTAYAINDSMVLKLFTDKYAFDMAKKDMDRLHHNPEIARTEAMIYDVGDLGTFEKTKIYYYIIERMKTTEQLDIESPVQYLAENIANEISNLKSIELRHLKFLISDPAKYAEIKKSVIQISLKIQEYLLTKYQYLVDKITQRVEKKNVILKPTWFLSLIEEMLMKYLTSRTDLHTGNLGLSQSGEFRYFDPTFKDWQSNFNLGKEREYQMNG